MSLVGLVKTLAIGGVVAGTVGVSGIISGPLTPPPANNLENEEEDSSLERDTQSSSASSSTDSGHSSSSTQQHSGRSSSDQRSNGHGTQGRDSTTGGSNASQQNIRHCLIVLTGRADQHSNKKIIVCSDAKNHLDVEKEKSKWGSMKWYLHDSEKNTLNEISGLMMDNDKPQRLWNWFWYENFYRWYKSEDSFWKGKYWKPYLNGSGGNTTVLEAEFDLPFGNGDKKFDSIYQRLHKTYSTGCGWRAIKCSQFKITKSYLSSYLNGLSNLGKSPHEKICLTLETGGSTSNTWTTKKPCPATHSK